MPITSNMVVASKGNRSTKSSDPFASPMFEGSADATRSVASAEVPSVGTIDNQVGNDAPGTVPTEQTHAASGSDTGAVGTSGTLNQDASFPHVPGDRGSDRSAPIIGTTPNE